jgi:hypothetical protein
MRRYEDIQALEGLKQRDEDELQNAVKKEKGISSRVSKSWRVPRGSWHSTGSSSALSRAGSGVTEPFEFAFPGESSPGSLTPRLRVPDMIASYYGRDKLWISAENQRQNLNPTPAGFSDKTGHK